MSNAVIIDVPVTTPVTTPHTIRMHERDNVVIVANDGGLPPGTVLPSGLALRNRVPQGHKGRVGRRGCRRVGAALRYPDRLRGEGHSGRQLGA